MQIRKLIFTAALVAATTPALAGNFYVLGSVGLSSADADTVGIENELRAVGLSNVSFDLDKTSTGYKLQLGYQFNPNWAIEGGFVDLGKFNYNLSATNIRGTGNLEASGFNVAALGLYPLNESAAGFVKLGALRSKVTNYIQLTNTINGASASASESATTWSPVVGLGANFALAPNLTLRLEVERYMNLGDADTSETDARLFSAGLAFKF